MTSLPISNLHRSGLTGSEMSTVMSRPAGSLAPDFSVDSATILAPGLSADSQKTILHRCIKCSAQFPHGFNTFCTSCGGMIDVFYNLKKAVLYDHDDPLQRFFDLLPVLTRESLKPFSLPQSPSVHARTLGRRLNMPWLYFKNETVLPTGSVKDRMAAVSVPFLRECGVQAFCASSTGNSSTSLARAMTQWQGGRMYLFTGEDFKNRVHCADNDQVVHFVLEGATFVEACTAAADFAIGHNMTPEQGFFNPARREGLKLSFLEAHEQIERPIDWYVQAVSSAMGVWGNFKGARELKEMGLIKQVPRLLCVQQSTCAPMVHAFSEESPSIHPRHIVEKPYGLASAILRGNPSKSYPYVRGIVLESNGAFASVTEQEIRDARTLTEDLEGITLCFTSSVAVAGLIKMAASGNLPLSDTVLINLTGRDRPEEGAAKNFHRLYKTNSGWRPDPSDTVAMQYWAK